MDWHGLIQDSMRGIPTDLKILDEATKKIDEGSAVDIVYVVFSKTFDEVPHDGLFLTIRSHAF